MARIAVVAHNMRNESAWPTLLCHDMNRQNYHGKNYPVWARKISVVWLLSQHNL